MRAKLVFSFVIMVCGFTGVHGLSVTEAFYTSYTEFCQEAANNESLFLNFRSAAPLRDMVENVAPQQGTQMLDAIQERYPDLLPHFVKICREDLFGKPVAYTYPIIGKCCPSTIRYVKIVGDLQKIFKNLRPFHIVEIGGGYGGQCKIIHDLCEFKKYSLVDLRPCLALVSRYLSHFQVPRVRYFSNLEIDKIGECDLVISNYAFSEIDREEQLIYLEKLVKAAPNGYITYNQVIYHYGLKSLSIDEMVAILSKEGREVTVEMENPLTGQGNVLIVWHPSGS